MGSVTRFPAGVSGAIMALPMPWIDVGASSTENTDIDRGALAIPFRCRLLGAEVYTKATAGTTAPTVSVAKGRGAVTASTRLCALTTVANGTNQVVFLPPVADSITNLDNEKAGGIKIDGTVRTPSIVLAAGDIITVRSVTAADGSVDHLLVTLLLLPDLREADALA